MPFLIDDLLMLVVAIGAIGISTTTSWGLILTALKGKKIAVIGARGSGKTTFFLYLEMVQKENLETEMTRTQKETRSSSINLDISGNNKKVFFQSTFDLPGSEEYRDGTQWKKSVNNSDIVLYFVHAAALLRGIDKSNLRNQKKSVEEIKQLSEQRVQDDLYWLFEWIRDMEKEKNKNLKTFIIGNHFDEIDEQFSNSNKIEGYENEFNANKVISQYGRGMIKIIGSLKSRETMKHILERVVENLEAT